MLPTYAYECKECGEFESEQKITEQPLEKCPTCGGRGVKRLIAGSGGFVLKGSNWVSKMPSSGDSPKKIADRVMKQTVGEVAADIARGTPRESH
jgi:putative FmdB family regulatory protein